MGENNPSRRPRREDYEHALQSMETFMDIGVNDLMTLAERAQHFAGQRAIGSHTISHIMSQPVRSVHPQTPMSEAAHMMVRERISGLPVVDDADHLVGIIQKYLPLLK